jgi:hypothetical protein
MTMSRSMLAGLAGATALAMAGAANAAAIIYQVDLSGPNESSLNTSPGIGDATITIDNVANTMRLQIDFSGLLGTTTAAFIHCCTTLADSGTAMVATQTPNFSGFPLGVTSGTYDNTFDLTLASSYNPAFVTAAGGTVASAESALLAGMASGTAYLNIHTTVMPGGEIRGFLEPAASGPAPEPAGWMLMIVGFGTMGAALRRRPAPNLLG